MNDNKAQIVVYVHGKGGSAEEATHYIPLFPDWSFSNIEIFCSDDPNSFLVECDGEGTSYVSGRPVHHKDHYVHKFLFRDGKICLYREFMNPCNELIELGVKMPEAPVTTEDMTEG